MWTLWSFVERLLPWKISRSFGQSTPTRSGQRHRRKASGLYSDDQYHSTASTKSRVNSISSSSFRSNHAATAAAMDPRRTNPSSCVDTDAFSAGSGSESRPRSKKSKKPRVPEESSLREMASIPRNQKTLIQSNNTSEPSGQSVSTTSPSQATTPIDSKPSTTTATSTISTISTSTSSGASKTDKADTSISTATSITSNIVYETADDDDFISTDRRRRRRAKGLKTNLDAHSSESLIKPIPCPQEEMEVNTSSQSNPSTGSTRASPVPDAPKVSNTNDNAAAAPTQSTAQTTASVSQDDHIPQKSTASQSQPLPPYGNHHQRQDSKLRNQQQKSASQPRRKEEIESLSKVTHAPTTATTTAATTATATSTTALLPTTATAMPSTISAGEPSFVHPLHALNSTSPIVRLKPSPSHKRSQSAQLPAASPWSIPHTAAAGGVTGGSKLAGGSSLSQMTLPLNVTAGPIIDPCTTSPSTTTPTTTVPSSETNKLESSGSGEYDLFGPSSGWYSPFQSGLDITIESDQEQGKHGSRSLTPPRVKVDAKAAASSQSRLTLGPFLPPSSFFESSPRTPRIMPFSQHHRSDSLGFGSGAGVSGSGSGIVGLGGSEDWSSVRTRSSSIAAPMTPLLETDCLDPMDYFGGSRSASSSRRGSVENNLTESLLSGRARMFASSDSSFGNGRPSQSGVGAGQHLAGAPGNASQSSLLGNSFLSPHHFSATISSRIQAAAAAATAAHSSASNSPVLGGQRSLELPIAITNAAATSTVSTGSSGAGGLLSDVGFDFSTATTTATTAMTVGTAPAFVNPWESNYPYKSSSHTMSDTFLPFGLVSSSMHNNSSSLDPQFHADQDRQSSLLRLMNGGSGSGGSSIDMGNGGDMDSRIGSQLQQHQRDDIESEAIRRGFLFPDLAHYTNSLGSSSSLHSTDISSSSSGIGVGVGGSGSSGGFHPFTSVEMSLAAAANQPPPPLQEEPTYDFIELSIPDLSRKRGLGLDGGIVGASGASSTGPFTGFGGAFSGHGGGSLTVAGGLRSGGGAESGEKRHRERGARHGRSRSGHHKSASLGSFFPPIPPASSTSSSSGGGGGGSGDLGSPGIQSNTTGETPSRHHNHGHSRLGRGAGGGTGGGGKEGESRRSRASSGVDAQDGNGGGGGSGGGTHSRGTSRHVDGSNGNSRTKRAPKKDQNQQN
ncbi:hypothetical protein BGX33_006270 [Mortierella sp. NVP41]|nr:hypothetical protein BGX33_006270 [Mortierella sp. NVP41]